MMMNRKAASYLNMKSNQQPYRLILTHHIPIINNRIRWNWNRTIAYKHFQTIAFCGRKAYMKIYSKMRVGEKYGNVIRNSLISSDYDQD